jgi:hypothetical protein
MNKTVSQRATDRLSLPILFVSSLICLSMTVPVCMTKGLAISHPIEHEQSDANTQEPETADQEGTRGTSQLIESLSASLRLYKTQPNAESWLAAWQNFKSLVWYVIVKHPGSQSTIKSVAPLNENGLKLTIGSNVKIWSFPKIADCQQVLVEWKETSYPQRLVSSGKRSRKRIVSLPAVAVTKIQSAPCPANTQIDDALIIYPGSQSDSLAKGIKVDSNLCLVLTGVNRRTGLMWLAGYRLLEGSWVPNSEIFSQIPPYLSQTLQGKASFSGSNLVLTVEETKVSSPATLPNTEKNQTCQSGGYKITFRLINTRYVLDNRLSVDLSNDPPASIAVQFAQALQKGRMDLAKAWLIDPQLASIPAYLGLYNHQSAAQFKLVRMATQGTGATRFRLITFAKDDLILDIGKIKGQWLVKGLFIAPADPLAKTLAGILTAE